MPRNSIAAPFETTSLSIVTIQQRIQERAAIEAFNGIEFELRAVQLTHKTLVS